jgi:hypothetical protein
MHIFKGFEDQSDTYHDTRTHYLMEQDPSLLQDQAEVMDVVAADKVEALKEEKMGPPGPCSSRSGSRYSMSRTCGPRDIISLVIPKVGDNRLPQDLQQLSLVDQAIYIYYIFFSLFQKFLLTHHQYLITDIYGCTFILQW